MATEITAAQRESGWEPLDPAWMLAVPAGAVAGGLYWMRRWGP
jgi:hypothetical protein